MIGSIYHTAGELTVGVIVFAFTAIATGVVQGDFTNKPTRVFFNLFNQMSKQVPVTYRIAVFPAEITITGIRNIFQLMKLKVFASLLPVIKAIAGAISFFNCFLMMTATYRESYEQQQTI